MNFKAIIFDLDNTLLDRTETFRLFTNKLISKYFNQHSNEQQQQLASIIIEKDEDGYKDKKQLFAELLELLPWSIKPAAGELLAYYEQEYVSSAVLMKDARELLEWCRSKYKTGLITNGRHAIQDGKLNKLQIKPYFHSIIISESAGVKKPNKMIFDLCLEQLEISAADCVYIGDHPVNDVEGAAKAGMHTIWMKVNQPWREELEHKPILTIHSLKELQQYLESL